MFKSSEIIFDQTKTYYEDDIVPFKSTYFSTTSVILTLDLISFIISLKVAMKFNLPKKNIVFGLYSKKIENDNLSIIFRFGLEKHYH